MADDKKYLDYDGLKYVWNKIKELPDGQSLGLSNDNSKFIIKEVKSDITKTTDMIPVAGGPLADLVSLKYPDGIPAGTDLQQILMDLLCEEKWPELIITKDASLISTMTEPIITLAPNSSTVEVGTEVSYTVTNGNSSYDAIPHTVIGFDYGYSRSNNNKQEFTENSVQSNFGDIKAVDNNITLTLSGFDTTSKTGPSVTITGKKIATPGANILGALNTSKTYTGTCSRLPVYYGCSNLKNTANEITKTSTEKGEVTLISEKVSKKTTNKTFYGKYKYFIGYYNDSTFADKVYTSTSIRSTDKKQEGWVNGTSINATITVSTGTKGMYIAIPEGVDDDGSTLDIIQTTAMNLPVSSDMIPNKRNLIINCAGTATKNYVIYTWSFPAGTSESQTFKISKF